jgi:UDP-N-acetylmuramoyl-tripeptide--D-alanyl-D-alanine ligase
VRSWTAGDVARAAGATRVSPPPVPASDDADEGPVRVTVDSREAGPGDLFVGLPGERVDGGRFAAQALAQGAWGVLVAPEHADAARCARPGVLLASVAPLAALAALAQAWRRALGAQVIGVTGSTGKTSTKDVLAALLAPHRRVVATDQNLNTEIGLPLTVLAAPAGTEVLVLEMAMRGSGQIAELARIAEPDVGVVTNVGPVHLELLGSVEAVAAAKGELLRALRPGTTAVVPAGEPLLTPHLPAGVRAVTFGPGGEVDASSLEAIDVGFTSAHMRLNAMAALAAARAIGVEPVGAVTVTLSALRGQRVPLPGGGVVIDDCYNANPMSMRAALDDLALSAGGRRVAVLGDMLELGPDSRAFHAQAAEHARAAGVDLLVTVGSQWDATGSPDLQVATASQAANGVPALLRAGDTVLVKGSRGVGLEVVARALRATG